MRTTAIDTVIATHRNCATKDVAVVALKSLGTAVTPSGSLTNISSEIRIVCHPPSLDCRDTATTLGVPNSLSPQNVRRFARKGHFDGRVWWKQGRGVAEEVALYRRTLPLFLSMQQ
mmetsp:Transcript_29295/g.87795  ORF Transcript_29295/g.87795 Transcript_29295/m.87795 type:complete len:116 (+) Transcript_29295:40-387(+)